MITKIIIFGKMLNKNISKQANYLESSKHLSQTVLLLKKKVRNVFMLRYTSNEDSYRKKIISDIIYNERSNLVAVFKDYLIYDDLSEFFKRYYKLQESYLRLPKFFDYYDNCSRIFPNYIILRESKYIYKNIQKKQKIIDIQQKMEKGVQEQGTDNIFNCEEKIFDTEVYNSIMSQSITQDQDLQNFFNSGMNPAENSIISIEKLIDSIEDTERNMVLLGKNKNSSVKRLMTVMSARNRVLANIPPKENSNNAYQSQEENNTTSEKKEIKTIEVCHSLRTSSNNIISTILDEKANSFESNLLAQKLNEKRNKIKYVYDSVNATTTIRDKLKGGYMKELNHRIHENYSPFRQSKRDDKSRTKPKTSSVPHKAPSIPKLTNNIFYIINQSPQIHTHITIYNNDSNQVSTLAVNSSGVMSKKDSLKDIFPKRNISKSKEKKGVEKIKSKTALNSKENKSSKDTRIFKSEVTYLLNQAKNLKTLNHPTAIQTMSTRAVTQSNAKTTSQKPEFLKIFPVQKSNIKQAARTTSTLKERKPALVLCDELNRNNQNITDKYPNTPTGKDKLASMRSFKFDKRETRHASPLTLKSSIKENNYLHNTNQVKIESRTSSAGKNIQNSSSMRRIRNVNVNFNINANVIMNCSPKPLPSPSNRTTEPKSMLTSGITTAKSELKIGFSQSNRPRQSIGDLQLPKEDSGAIRPLEHNKLNTISTAPTKVSPAIKHMIINNFGDMFKQRSPMKNIFDKIPGGTKKWPKK